MATAADPRQLPLTPAELRVLLVDDSREDALLTRKIIERGLPEHVRMTISVSRSLREAREALSAPPLEGAYDCVLLDLHLYDGRGVGNIDAVRAVAPQVPVVVLSGLDDPLAKEQAREHGAQAYVVKKPPSCSDNIYEVIALVAAGSPLATGNG